MADDSESAFAAWLDSPETMREMDVIRDRITRHQGYPPSATEIINIALQMEILVSLDIYGDKDNTIIGLIKPEDLPDEENDDPWNTGWKP